MSVRDGILFVELGIDATNEDIIKQMKIMRKCRLDNFKHVVCGIRGFEADKRELYEIPEVRAFCRRLVNLGFIADLNGSVGLEQATQEDGLENTWGAFEVWACSEGFLQIKMKVYQHMMNNFAKTLEKANKTADKAVES